MEQHADYKKMFTEQAHIRLSRESSAVRGVINFIQLNYCSVKYQIINMLSSNAL